MTHVVLAVSNWLNFDFITNAYKNFTRAWAHRRQVRITINELNSLSDRELNDMGMSRGMIRSVAEGTNDV